MNNAGPGDFDCDDKLYNADGLYGDISPTVLKIVESTWPTIKDLLNKCCLYI